MKSLQGLLSAFGKLCLNIFCRDQITCVRRIQARLNLAPKPLGMVRGILLGLHKITHKVSQKLRTCSVTCLGCSRKALLQFFFDTEGKGSFGHGSHPMCYTASAM